jgi:hypothetical protein
MSPDGRMAPVAAFNIRYVSERDVDLLLAASILQDADFRAKLLGTIDPKLMVASLETVRHSVDAENGETDLEVVLAHGGRRIAVLIEDKVDAELQPNQPARYVERGTAGITAHAWDEFHLVLFAPADYIAHLNEQVHPALTRFRKIPFQTVLEWSPRTALAEVLRVGIRRVAERKLAPDHADTTAFWHSFYEDLQAAQPTWPLKDPGPRKKDGGFYIFQAPGLPKELGMRFYVKFSFGQAQIEIAGLGDHVPHLNEALLPILGRFSVEQTGGSAAITATFPKLLPLLPYEGQRGNAEQAIQAVTALHAWFMENRLAVTATVRALQGRAKATASA